jgi:hypothetical protein
MFVKRGRVGLSNGVGDSSVHFHFPPFMAIIFFIGSPTIITSSHHCTFVFSFSVFHLSPSLITRSCCLPICVCVRGWHLAILFSVHHYCQVQQEQRHSHPSHSCVFPDCFPLAIAQLVLHIHCSHPSKT